MTDNSTREIALRWVELYNDGTPEARQGLYERIYAAMRASCAAPVFAPVSGNPSQR